MDRPLSPAPNGQLVRLLGLAFAGSDLVFEVDAQGLITFALGAAERVTGRPEKQLVGLSWTEIVAPEEADLLQALQQSVAEGERQGPLRVAMREIGSSKRKRSSMLSVFRLPHNQQRLSCALSLGPPPSTHQQTDKWGLMEPEAFAGAAAALIEEAQDAGLPVRMDLVELAGLAAKMKSMAPVDAAATRRRLAAAFRAEAYQGVGASEVAADRYAVLRGGNASADRVAERLKAATGPGISPLVAELPLPPDAEDPTMKAVRYALDRFIEAGPAAAQEGFAASVQRTVEDTTRFQSVLSEGCFDLAYQPIVYLSDRRLHHFEALARFDADKSPADTIRLAEELDLILDFDLAVAKSVGKVLTAHPDVKVAINVSAISLMQPRFVQILSKDLLADSKLRKRMLLEITETRRLDDLGRAKAAIEALGRAGYVVCLDDFGAGAASLDYLRRLPFAYAKIDGRFIQQLGSSSRDAIILKHIVALCRDLGVYTIAEMIETRQTAEAARSLGVDLGQGWAFSKPLPEPVWGQETPSVSARRRGEREDWS